MYVKSCLFVLVFNPSLAMTPSASQGPIPDPRQWGYNLGLAELPDPEKWETTPLSSIKLRKSILTTHGTLGPCRTIGKVSFGDLLGKQRCLISIGSLSRFSCVTFSHICVHLYSSLEHIRRNREADLKAHLPVEDSGEFDLTQVNKLWGLERCLASSAVTFGSRVHAYSFRDRLLIPSV
jgi:hypothetical protein